MSKNIVLCADGTGNRGGETPDTNVYRMYHAVELHQPTRQRNQITFYDNGVGTSANKYIRAVTGALGFGFGKNVRHLYEFLARNYEAGDIVYLFGFSRGAATVRAFGGMLQECGLLDRNHADCKTDGQFDYEKFSKLIDKAFKHYKRKTGSEFKNRSSTTKEIRIKFIGIWDTVSALGFPYQRTGDSIIEDSLERPIPVLLARLCDTIFNFGPLAHKFYNYDPNKIVDHVYHAIAIDDERKSFLPRVWDEIDPKLKGSITQVWFAGMHSDVGGSYSQTGLAYETMAWMMERAEHHGLDFVNGRLDEAKARANVHGRLHNSRDGLAIYYRYAPRDIESLCSSSKDRNLSKLKGPIKIHRSVVDRMGRATDRYAPGLLPTEFEIVDTPISVKNTAAPVAFGIDTPNPVDPHVVDAATIVSPKDEDSGWKEDRKKVEKVVRSRRRLYRIFADYSFAIVVAATGLWFYGVDSIKTLNDFLDANIPSILTPDTVPLSFPYFPFVEGGIVFDGDILKYITPKMFEDLIDMVWVTYPIISLLIVLGFIILLIIKTKKSKSTVKLSISIRTRIELLLAAQGDLNNDAKQVASQHSENSDAN